MLRPRHRSSSTPVILCQGGSPRGGAGSGPYAAALPFVFAILPAPSPARIGAWLDTGGFGKAWPRRGPSGAPDTRERCQPHFGVRSSAWRRSERPGTGRAVATCPCGKPAAWLHPGRSASTTLSRRLSRLMASGRSHPRPRPSAGDGRGRAPVVAGSSSSRRGVDRLLCSVPTGAKWPRAGRTWAAVLIKVPGRRAVLDRPGGPGDDSRFRGG